MCVGKSLIFPIPLFLLPKFNAADGVFRAIRAASPGVRLCVPTRSQSFQGVQCCTALRSQSFPDKPKGCTARGQGALQRGRLHHKPVLGQEQFHRAARSAPGQFCCQHRNGGSNPVATAGLGGGFSGKIGAKAKSENRPRCRAKSESRPRWKNPDLGAGSAVRCRAGAAGLLCRHRHIS